MTDWICPNWEGSVDVTLKSSRSVKGLIFTSDAEPSCRDVLELAALGEDPLETCDDRELTALEADSLEACDDWELTAAEVEPLFD